MNFVFVKLRNSGGCFSLKVLVHCERKLTSVGGRLFSAIVLFSIDGGGYLSSALQPFGDETHSDFRDADWSNGTNHAELR